MKKSNGWTQVLPSLITPICFGLILYLAIMILIERDFITNDLVLRYLTGHPISKLTLALFCIGTASLFLIGDNVFGQFSGLRKIGLNPEEGETGAEGQAGRGRAAGSEYVGTVEQASQQLARLSELPSQLHEHYLWRRLRDSLNHIRQTGSFRGVDQHLRHLAENDLDFQEHRYSLVRILIWATPMLGFLGTVLGISAALGSIDVGPDNDFAKMMGGLRGSLYVAFDTTALALCLSMLLMFGQFLVNRFESHLLRSVDSRTYAELSGQFDLAIKDETVEAVERIGQTVLLATHEVVQQQADIWRESLDSAERAWVESVDGANRLASQNLEDAVDRTAESLAHYLAQAIEKADESFARRWEQWQVALGQNARNLCEHQKELATQSELAKEILQQLNQVGKNQQTVNLNLEALTTSRELKEVLAKLERAIAGPSQSAGTTVDKRGPGPNNRISEVTLPFPEPARAGVDEPGPTAVSSGRVSNASPEAVLKAILTFPPTTQTRKSA